jgi:hypothetical protein
MKNFNKFGFLNVSFWLILALLEKVAFDLGPNRELITATMIVTTLTLGRKNSLAVMALLLVLGDLIFGNTSIFLFTWSGFLLPILILPKITSLLNEKVVTSMLTGTGFGIASVLFFFIWTNFGVWLLDSWQMYPNTLTGLVASYVNALPFLKLQLQSTVLSIPLAIAMWRGTLALDKQPAQGVALDHVS